MHILTFTNLFKKSYLSCAADLFCGVFELGKLNCVKVWVFNFLPSSSKFIRHHCWLRFTWRNITLRKLFFFGGHRNFCSFSQLKLDAIKHKNWNFLFWVVWVSNKVYRTLKNLLKYPEIDFYVFLDTKNFRRRAPWNAGFQDCPSVRKKGTFPSKLCQSWGFSNKCCWCGILVVRYFEE